MDEVPQRQLRMERNRHILVYNRKIFSLEKLEQSVAFLKDAAGFRARHGDHGRHAPLREHRAVGDRGRAASWPPSGTPRSGPAATPHREGQEMDERGVPVEVARFDEELERDHQPRARERPRQGQDRQGARQRASRPRSRWNWIRPPCCCAGASDRPMADARRWPTTSGAASASGSPPPAPGPAGPRTRSGWWPSPSGSPATWWSTPAAAGQWDLGENRVPEALDRQAELAGLLARRRPDPADRPLALHRSPAEQQGRQGRRPFRPAARRRFAASWPSGCPRWPSRRARPRPSCWRSTSPAKPRNTVSHRTRSRTLAGRGGPARPGPAGPDGHGPLRGRRNGTARPFRRLAPAGRRRPARPPGWPCPN